MTGMEVEVNDNAQGNKYRIFDKVLEDSIYKFEQIEGFFFAT